MRNQLGSVDFSSEFALARVRSGLSQVSLASSAGVSEVTIRNWESGVSKPKGDHLWRAFGVLLQQGAFTEGTELEEARRLWLLAQEENLRLKAAFDEPGFRRLMMSQQKQIIGEEKELKRKITMRGITLLEAIDSVGLVDIENRDDEMKGLPPKTYYQSAKEEIVITAITAHQTFTRSDDWIREALSASKSVRALILFPDPNLIEKERLYEREELDIVQEIWSVIKTILLQKLEQRSKFEIRFMQRMPPFSAVMIDGDVTHEEESPRDPEGQIRVQPSTMYGTQHRGVVLQFKKIAGSAISGFDYYARDVRRQWREGKRLDEVLEYANQLKKNPLL